MDPWVDAIRLQSILEGINSVSYLILCILELILGNCVEFLGLLEVELKLVALTVSLALLILLPVFYTLLVPLLHEAGISLQLVDLNSAHFLFPHRGHLLVFIVAPCCIICLSFRFFIKLP